jgi:hypothetical protein
MGLAHKKYDIVADYLSPARLPLVSADLNTNNFKKFVAGF